MTRHLLGLLAVVAAPAVVADTAVKGAIVLAGAFAPAEYVVGYEDLLRVSVWGEPQLSMAVSVRPDGKITMPLVDEVDAAGRTVAQIRDEIREKLAAAVRDPRVTVIVEQSNSFQIFMLGEVKTQGTLTLRRPTRLLQAIASAGGLTPYARAELVLRRDNGGSEQILKIDYRALMAGDRNVENLWLRPGDTIVVF